MCQPNNKKLKVMDCKLDHVEDHYDWGLLHKHRMVRVLEQFMEKARICSFLARCRALNADLVNPGTFTDEDLLNSY